MSIKSPQTQPEFNAPSSLAPSSKDLDDAAAHMLNAESTGNSTLCELTVVDFNNKEIPLKTVQYEMIFELREFLSEHINTCFFTNFYFEQNGQPLNEYVEIAELDLAQNPKIFMRPKAYDDTTARNHIKRLVDVLERPCVLTNHSYSSKMSEELKKPRSRTSSQSGEKELKPPSEQDEKKIKKSYEEFLNVIKTHQTDTVQIQDKDRHVGLQNPFKDLFSNAISLSSVNKLKHLKCIESLQICPRQPAERLLQGDLLYLSVKTLDSSNVEIGITCTVNGFFQNQSTTNTFNPLPSKTNPCFSYTLVGCLHRLSSSFGRNLEIYLNSILKTEPYFLQQPSRPLNPWLVQPSSVLNKMNSIEELGQALVPLHGLEPKALRDWNEEFQVVQNFPSENFLQRMQKDRAVAKIYSDFVEAATTGAQAIIEGKLISLNPNEPQRQHVYVYNQIFFSFAIDSPLNYNDLTNLDQSPSFTQSNHDLKGLNQLYEANIQGLFYLATCLVNYRGHRLICQSIIPGILNNSDLQSLAEYGTVDEKKNIVANEQFHILMTKLAQSLNVKLNKIVDVNDGKIVEIAGSIEVKGIRGSDKRPYVVDLQGLTPRDANLVGDQNHTALVRPELIGLYQRAKNMNFAQEKMKEFNLNLEAKRAPEPKPEEGKELTDEQKAQIQRQRQEESILKFKEVERLIQQAPKYKFNVNVFRKEVKLALDDAELKQEEELVIDLAKFLKNDQIDAVVNELKSNEGVPTDSQSLKELLHRNGVNMRYLGEIHNRLCQPQSNENDLKMRGEPLHLKSLIEREILLRSAKHVFNRIIKEESGTSSLHLGSCAAHLLNCLLSCQNFHHYLNNNLLKFEDQSLQTQFSEFPEEMVASQQPIEEPQQQPSQKSKKKKPQQKKEVDTVKELPKEMSDILFSTDVQEFKLQDIFSTPMLSQSLYRCPTATCFKYTPSSLFAEIKDIALHRFSHKIADIKKIYCLNSVFAKTSLLRDLCKCLGIQLINKHYMLSNNVKQVLSFFNEPIEQQNQQNKSKKQPKATLLTEQDLYKSYKYLPFQSSDCVKFFPVVKTMNFKNQDVKSFLTQANIAFKENSLDQAFELYSQAINIILQIYGPMNKDVAMCISQIASVQFKFGDFLQAIELQTKSILLQERLFGLDDAQIAYGYSTLAMYYHSCGYFAKGFEYMQRALSLLSVVAGDVHPEIANIYLNLGMMYQETEQNDAAVQSYLSNLQLNTLMLGGTNIHTASSNQALAQAYCRNQEFRKALESQEQAHKQLLSFLPEQNAYVQASKQQLDYYFRLSVQAERMKTQKQGKVDLKLIEAIQAAHKQHLEKYGDSGQGEKGDPAFITADQLEAIRKEQQQQQLQQQQQASINAYTQRYNRLMARMNNPKQRNVLDVLEYQAFRNKQAEFAKEVAAQMKENQETKKE